HRRGGRIRAGGRRLREGRRAQLREPPDRHSFPGERGVSRSDHVRATSGVGSMSIQRRADRRTRDGEAGLALIWAILVMIVVLGAITVSIGMTLVRTDET